MNQRIAASISELPPRVLQSCVSEHPKHYVDFGLQYPNRDAG